MDLFRAKRGVLQQAFAQVSEVSIRVSVRRHALVHLKNVDARPRDVFARQRAQHDPGSVTTADRQSISPAGRDRCTSI